MVNSDENYRREEDRKWRERTEERVLALTSSETVQNDRLDEIDDEIRVVKEVLDGKPSDKDDTGMKGDLDQIQSRLRRIDAILWPDALGNSGLVNDVSKLKKKDEREERRSDRWWRGLTPIIVAIVSTIGLVLTNLDRIVPPLRKLFGGRDAEISSPSKRSSVKTNKKRHRRVIEAPTEATDNEPAKEELPDGRSGDGGHAE